jgi:hypothetical protein
VTVIEIKPFRNGWKCFEAPGVEPVFLDQEQAIDYARNRACFALVKFAFWIQPEISNAASRSRKQIDGNHEIERTKLADVTSGQD